VEVSQGRARLTAEQLHGSDKKGHPRERQAGPRSALSPDACGRDPAPGRIPSRGARWWAGLFWVSTHMPA